MTASGFPTDDYTPHGYLANPFAVAHSWSDGEGGCLRTSRENLGLGWQLPWPQNARASVELVVNLEGAGQRFGTRSDFAAAGLTSPHHSANLFAYQWETLGRRWEASFVLIERDMLGLEVGWETLGGTLPEAALTIELLQQGDTGDWELLQSGDEVAATASGSISVVARRQESPTPLLPPPCAGDGVGDISSVVSAVRTRARAEDAAFWDGSARLEGDWPASWRRGWVYDVETTRMCVFPPGGIFMDVWPAWTVQWPRAVVAEGTLDMARFAYASPDLALRATLSLFRDAEAPNVPCVFRDGEPNMVAKDGAICGTSPAWCIPFYNLERLFAQTLDRAWLAEIYPFLARYVEWWLAERTDADGWAVYKCTWEAGEDDNPRLDPERKGDNVVSAFVRPVELQATMALSAGVLARFAAALDQHDDIERWQAVEAAFLARTADLWDPAEGRFRDWDLRHDQFVAPSKESNYWGVDTCRYSALAFTPLLADLSSDEIRAGLRRELAHYAGPPWTLWPSWSYVVLEAAPLTGDTAFAGRIAAEIVGRVYDELDLREPGGPKHPIPGVAREYWPLELDTWASCEGYGWGANTASLLVRQIFGFFEGPYLDDQGALVGTETLTFELRPSLPDHFLVPGREYWLAGLPYRGGRLSLGYRVGEAPGSLTLLISAGVPTRCMVLSGDDTAYESAVLQAQHEIVGQNGSRYIVEIWAGGWG